MLPTSTGRSTWPRAEVAGVRGVGIDCDQRVRGVGLISAHHQRTVSRAVGIDGGKLFASTYSLFFLGIGGSDIGDTVNGLLGGVGGVTGGDVGDTFNGLLGGTGLTGQLLNADVSGPVDANANIGSGTGDPLINAGLNAPDAGTGLVSGDLGNLLGSRPSELPC